MQYSMQVQSMSMGSLSVMVRVLLVGAKASTLKEAQEKFTQASQQKNGTTSSSAKISVGVRLSSIISGVSASKI